MANEEDVKGFFERNNPLAAKIAGAAVGVAAGLGSGVPWLGTLASPVIAHYLERAGKELIDRHLAPRQQVRVTRAVTVAVEKAAELVAAGKMPRDDEFMMPVDDSGRTNADEVTEAALMAAMNAAEERKVDFIGSLIASLVFRPDIGAATAHLLISLLSSTTYRGLILLRVIADNAPGHFPSRGHGNVPPYPAELTPIAIEVTELVNRGLVTMRDGPDSADSYLFTGHEMVDPSLLYLTNVGTLLVELASLRSISLDDLATEMTVRELSALSQTMPGTSIIDGGTF